jgi:hypothetical protein
MLDDDHHSIFYHPALAGNIDGMPCIGMGSTHQQNHQPAHSSHSEHRLSIKKLNEFMSTAAT